MPPSARVLLAGLLVAGALDVHEWYGRSIYFVVTDRFAKTSSSEDASPMCNGREWCGGTFRGIRRKLDYIQAMGFDALWITPVVEQVDWRDNWNGTGYHGYWAKDFFAIDSHFGTQEDLLDLRVELKRRGMLLMIDIVVNHVGPIHSIRDIQHLGDGLNNVDGSQFHQLDRRPDQSLGDYIRKPVSMYDAGDGCWPNYSFPDGCNESIILDGWFGDLADLRQENPATRDYLLTWIQHMVKTYAPDAFRLDTALYVPKWFLRELQAAAGVPIIGEVVTYNMSLHSSYAPPLGSLLNFPIALHLQHDLSSEGSLAHFRDVLDAQAKAGYSDLLFLGNFIDNHDNERFLYTHHGDLTQVRNGLIWTLFYHGLPMVYYGTEQPAVSNVSDERTSMWPDHYDNATEMYAFLSRAHRLRRASGLAYGGAHSSSLAVTLQADEHHLAFARGDLLVLVTNLGASASAPAAHLCVPLAALPQSWSSVQDFDAVLGQGETELLDAERLCVSSPDGEPTVFARTGAMASTPVLFE